MVAADRPGDLATLARLVAEAGHYTTTADGRFLRVQAPATFAAELNRLAMSNGVTLVELRPEQPSLEDTFLQMTSQSPTEVP